MFLNMKRVIFFGAASLCLFSCGSSSNMPSVSNVDAGAGACPAGIGGMDASCCNAGVPITPTPSGCNVVVPGSAGVASSLGAGAASAGTSAGENQAASQLTGGQKMGTLAGQSSAATAGTQAPLTGGGGLSNPLGQSGLGVTTSGNANTASPSGVGDASNVSTAPAPSGTPDSNGTGNGDGTGVSVGLYADGGNGAGGVLPNGAKATGFQFGNGLAEGGAAGSGELGFGASRSPASATIAGLDPSDYFTRISLDESLFKKVEKRYRSTSANWETAYLNNMSTVSVKTRK
jgi:hypothetical protein